MKEPIRVLQVLGGTSLGGAESRVMDSYRHMDRDRIQFDFCVHSEETGFFDEEIERLGGHVYRVPRFRVTNWHAYRKAWKAFFAEHPGYRAVHGHMTSTASIYLPIAKKSGVPLTIAHARSAGVDPGLKGMLTRILRRNLGKKADLCLTCSYLAGEAVFGKKMARAGLVQTVPNAIDASAFAYNKEIRESMRHQLRILDVFERVNKELPGSRLLLVGEGSLLPAVKEKAASLGLLDNVIFTGNQAKVSDYYQAMDFFVFPSIFEGLPGTVIEAQASGLRCLISDSVTPEVLITGLAQAMPLSLGADRWAANILERKGYSREQMEQAVKDAGFDVSDQVKMLETIYLQEKIL